MDSELLQAFIEEAESYLPTIRGGILVCVQDGKSHSELETSLRQLHTIKGAAMMIGLTEIGNLADELERDIEPIYQAKEVVSDEKFRGVLDKLAQIEAFLMTSRMNTGEFSLDFNNFVEESFENLQINSPNHQEISAEMFEETSMEMPEDEMSDSWDEEDFEIDDEMLEVFAMEAEDLLRNLGINLEILSNHPDNREALMEIRRNAHTFKGSAGIVGLKKPSKLAHRVEDLLDFVAEKNIPSNEKIFELLLTSTDCLSAMINGDDSPQLNNKVTRLYQNFDAMMESLTAPVTQNKKVKSAKNTIVSIPKPRFEVAEAERVKEDAQSPQSVNAGSKSIVRVSLERLDDLVKIVSGLVVSRSVFEQRLGEFERQIEELNLSTRRLQRSTAKLETDFEADMISVRSSSFGVQSAPFGFNYNSFLPPAQEFDSLEFDRYTDFHQTTRELVETTSDAFSINSALDSLRSNFEMLFDSQRRLIEDMQSKLLRIRMVRFDSLSSRLTRTVRVTCEEELKQASLHIEGENIEVDTQILDSLIEPLLHLLRNAVAHGIEPPDMRRLLGKPEKGKINLRVHNEGTHIVLTITDDGRGISAADLKRKAIENGFISFEDAETMNEEDAFELVFLQGLTTAKKLSQVSGRGVGMNVVRTTIERQQGTISITSEPQKGTTFTLRLPMSLAVTRVLLVKVNENSFAFPLKLVNHISEVSAESLEKAQGEKSIEFGSGKYTFTHLNEILGMPVLNRVKSENNPLLLLDTMENPCALMVDEIIKPEEVLIKPLGSPLQSMPELLGATVLGDGSVVPVLDLVYLLNQKKSKIRKLKSTAENEGKVKTQINVMIVDDSPSVRHMTSKVVKNGGFNPIIAKDGLEALDILQSADILPDVILTDVEMPRMDGYELLSSLKKQSDLYNIPVVMITSRAGDKHRQKAVELGVSEYLTKPYEDTKLIEIISRLSQV